MFLQIVENSATITDYQKYIFKTVLKHSSKRIRRPVELRVAEESTPYPEIEIINEDNISHEELVARMTKERGYWLQFFPWSNLEGKIFPITKEDIKRSEKDLVILYTREYLKGLCQVETAEIGPNSEFGTIFYLKTENLNAIKERARSLNVEFNNPNGLREKLKHTPSEFLDNPPRIRWGDFEIEIPSNSIELDVCRIAFRSAPKTEIDYNTVAEEIEQDNPDSAKDWRRLIYDAIRRINNRVKYIAKKGLFIWTEHAFYRKY